MNKGVRAVSVLAAFTVLLLAGVPTVRGADFGPSKGSLVIVGGAMKDPAILKRFLELAGGPDQPIVVIPTAGEADKYDQTFPGLKAFRDAGATKLTVLHTRDRMVADSPAFVEPIRQARGVFFEGGRQWRLADAYLDTLTHKELFALLDRGGVIGGSSAGATIQGDFLARGDTKGAEIMMGDHQQGLAFVKKVAIDQHLLKRNRQFDLVALIEARPDLLGIGLDEDTAIVVQGDEFQVLGRSYVAIYDRQRQIPPAGKFYFLTSGDRFSLKTRQATRPSPRGAGPIDRVKDGQWGK
ncbi:MAG TPA: cyanophycinase [Vicinamibacterales bacterium]|jgi:cyanophycinase